MKMTIVFASGAIMLASIAGLSSLRAEEGAEPGWSGDVGLGLVVTTGNTDTETINAKTRWSIAPRPGSIRGNWIC